LIRPLRSSEMYLDRPSFAQLTRPTPSPVKPEIVTEGGKIGINGSDEFHDEIPDLLPLTMYYKPQDTRLAPTWGTSAACSNAARLGAQVMADYPTLWPETVGGLVGHASR